MGMDERVSVEFTKFISYLVKYGIRHEVCGSRIYMPCQDKPRTVVGKNVNGTLRLSRTTRGGYQKSVYNCMKADTLFYKIDPQDAEAEGISYNGKKVYDRPVGMTAEDRTSAPLSIIEKARIEEERRAAEREYGGWINDKER